MDGIFISYRRDDSAGYAGRLYDRLVAHFGAGRVFMDVEGIEAGLDFVDAIESAVGSCRVLIAIIGDEWVTAADVAGRRRLDDPNDFIRLETSAALKRGIRVVPVLIGGAVMPLASDLPDDLKALTRRQAIEINHKQWEASTGELIRALESILGGQPGEPAGRRGEGGRPPATPAQGGERRWLVPAVLAAMIAGAGLWAFVGGGGDDPGTTGPGTAVSVAVAPESRTADPLPAAAPVAAKPETQPAPAPVEAPPAAPVEPPRPAAAPAAPAPAPVVPAIREFRAETSAAGRSRLCYRVSQAESLSLTPRPGELQRLEEGCVAVRVSEETTFTLTARNGDQVVRRTLVMAPAPVAATAEPPRSPAAVAAPAPAAAQPADAAPAALPLKGERWIYLVAGKWPTSPKGRYEIVVQSVAGGLVTESLTRGEPGRGEEVRRGRSDRADFVVWPSIGPEFSPHFGAFVNLAQPPSLTGIATPDFDPQWRQWYSEAKVLGEESVSVPAGAFKAFKVEVWSNRRQTGSSTVAAVEPVRVQFIVWYAPAVKRYVRMQRRILSVTGVELERDVFELAAHRLP